METIHYQEVIQEPHDRISPSRYLELSRKELERYGIMMEYYSENPQRIMPNADHFVDIMDRLSLLRNSLKDSDLGSSLGPLNGFFSNKCIENGEIL